MLYRRRVLVVRVRVKSKPRLARRMETIPGGDGILLDDVVAGLYGLVLIIVPARLLLSDLPWSVIGTS